MIKTPEDILKKKHGKDFCEYNETFYRASVVIEAMLEYASQFKEKPKQTIEERHSSFFDCVHSIIMKDNMDIPKNQIQDFIDYWTEISPNAKKMRFEKEKVFDIKKRLERWSKNQKTFNNGNTTKQTRHDKFESAFARTDENSGAGQTFDKV